MVSRSHGTSSEPGDENTNTSFHEMKIEETGDEFFHRNIGRYRHRKDTKDTSKLGWAFVLTNLLLEILVLAFDQMASPHHPQYGLIVWGLSSAVMFISIAELIYKGMIKEKLSVLQCLKSLLPFSSSGGKKPYSFVDGLILLGTKVQMVLASIAYAYLSQGKENPIKISLVSLVFMVCYAFSKLHKDGNEANLLPVRQEN